MLTRGEHVIQYDTRIYVIEHGKVTYDLHNDGCGNFE